VTTGAEVIVAALEDAGVEVCFGLPGVHNLALWEALRPSRVRLVGVRHEQAAAYAADGYARATGRLGVALTTTGPGAANTLGAVGEAWASRSPVLVIATDIPTTLRREGVYRGVLHETDGQAAMFAPVVKASFSGPEAVGDAIAAALAQPQRPVYLEVATDLLRAPASPAAGPGPRSIPMAASAGEAARLPEAARPLVWAGAGARDAAAEVTALAEHLGAPVLTTYGGRGVIASEHPLAVGMPPHVPSAGALWDEADLVISVGSDLDGMNTQNWAMPQPPALVAVNVDAADAGKNYRVDRVLETDAAAGCAALTGDGTRPCWADLRRVRALACAELDDRGLRFLDALAYALPADALVVCDMCIPGYWIAGFRAFRGPRHLLFPMGWGTLGFGFPAALGAALAAEDGPTVAVCGDGGFLFAAGELATVAQEQLPLTTVIVDDGGYGMLRFDQDQAGEERFGVDLRTPDFEALARAFGVEAETVGDLDDDFGEALARHVADPAPSVLVARCEALTPPPTTSPRWYRRAAGQA
jgi:thiamine pyrophosphate-dependent acetolactate synthase large subunit-like protein